MKQPYALVIILMVICFLGALIAGPHSCRGGLDIYFYYGCAALLATVVILWSAKTIPKQKKAVVVPIGAIAFVAIWIAGIFAGDFNLMCRLF